MSGGVVAAAYHTARCAIARTMSSLVAYDAYTLAELEYLAENELIEISPRLKVDQPLQLLSVRSAGGPFFSGLCQCSAGCDMPTRGSVGDDAGAASHA